MWQVRAGRPLSSDNNEHHTRELCFGFLVQALLICWYVRWAHDPADIDGTAPAVPVVPHRDQPVILRYAHSAAPKTPHSPNFRHWARPARP